MKIISWNVNGLRAATRHGFLNQIKNMNPDILCLQEIKAEKADLDTDVGNINGYTSYFNSALIKGYAGTAVYTKVAPLHIEFDVLMSQQITDEGRTMLLEFKDFSLLNVYIPHGSRDKSKLPYKLTFYELLSSFIANYTNKPLILTGDFNVAREDIDLARPKQNRNNTMFTPEERSCLEQLLDLGFADTFRDIHKDQIAYSWWPYLADTRERNIGWRIDYILASNELSQKVIKAEVLTQVIGSDHCPVSIEMQ